MGSRATDTHELNEPPSQRDLSVSVNLIVEVRWSAATGAGNGFFVPADAHCAYEAGPEGAVVLEFRTQTSFDMQIPGGQLERWRRMATVAVEHGDRWIELRSESTA